MNNIVIWEGTDWKSMECLDWHAAAAGTIIHSSIIGVYEGKPFHYKYRIEVDEQWRTEYFLVSDMLDTGNKLELRSDKRGNWFDNEKEMSSFKGCIDIDFSLTAFTNTLPIRRLDWEQGDRQPIEVLYIKLPELTMKKVNQVYTRINDNRFQYEGIFRNYVAVVDVDENKMVTDYPDLVKRLYPVGAKDK